jgi:S1-C subfamily serine protease
VAAVLIVLALTLATRLFQLRHSAKTNVVAGAKTGAATDLNPVTRQPAVVGDEQHALTEAPDTAQNLFRPHRVRKGLSVPLIERGDSNDDARFLPSNATLADINAVVMNSTFFITSKRSAGTGFILQEVDKKHNGTKQYILITAAHLLSESMQDGSTMTIRFRRKSENDPIQWETEDRQIKIADARGPLWVKHPRADVAALAIDVPEGIIETPLPARVLGEKQTLKELSPGTDVYALGFPFGAAGDLTFPILRPATIASGSVSGDKGSFALAMAVFPGDSGGPLYSIEQSGQKSQIHILGLIVGSPIAKATNENPTGAALLNFFGTGYAAAAPEVSQTAELLRAKREPEPTDGRIVMQCLCNTYLNGALVSSVPIPPGARCGLQVCGRR